MIMSENFLKTVLTQQASAVNNINLIKCDHDY